MLFDLPLVHHWKDGLSLVEATAASLIGRRSYRTESQPALASLLVFSIMRSHEFGQNLYQVRENHHNSPDVNFYM